MILKKLQTGATTVIVTKKEYDEYISQGYTYVEDVEVAIDIDEAEEENVRFKIEDDKLYWKYESDFAWTEFVVGGGGDTYKVKVDETGTADYLDQKVIAGNNVTVTKAGDKLVIASTASGGSGVTVYADLAAIKAVDTTSYTTVETVQVASLGLYKFQPSSTLTGDDINVITPTTGSSAGRWIKQSIDIVEQSTASWGKVEVPSISGRQIKNNSVTKQKKVVFIGSSVLLGTGATTYANSYAGLLATALQAETDITFTGFENRGITANTSTQVRERVVNEVCSLNPDIVIIGLSSNNNGIASQSTEENANKIISTYIEALVQVCSILQERGIQFIITGEYGIGSATAIAVRAKKALNYKLSRLFKNKFVNLLGNVANDSDGAWVTQAGSSDGAHPGDAGHLAIFNNIDINAIKEPYCDFKDFVEYGGYCTMNTTTGFQALYVAPNGSTATSFVKNYTCFVDVNKGVGENNKILLKTKRSSSIAGIVVRTDANGYIAIYEGTTLKYTSTITLKEKEMTRICVTTNALTSLATLWVNGTMLYSWTLASALNANILDLKLGGNGNDITDNAVGYGFSNLVLYSGVLDNYAIDKCFKGEWFSSNIIFAHNLNISDSLETSLISQCSQYNGKIVSYLQNLGVFTNSSSTIIKFTDTEKAKLANSLNGTFTTADGKTITITGGMVTSIV